MAGRRPGVAGHRGRAGLDEPRLAAKRAPGVLAGRTRRRAVGPWRRPCDRAPSPRRVACASSAQASSGAASTTWRNRACAFVQPLELRNASAERNSNAGRKGDRMPRLRAASTRRDQRRLRPIMLQLDRGELQGGLRRRSGSPGPRPAPGAAAAASSSRPSRSRARARRSLASPFSVLSGTARSRVCQRLDGLARPDPPPARSSRSGARPGRPTPGPPRCTSFAEQAHRPIAIAQDGERPRQAVPRPIGEPPAGMIRQRPFVGRPGRRHVVQGEADVAQVGPGGLQCRVGGLIRREGLERPRAAARSPVRYDSSPTRYRAVRDRGSCGRPRGTRRRRGASPAYRPWSSRALARPKRASSRSAPEGPVGQEPLVLLGRQVELPLPEQPMRESQRIGDPPARRGSRRLPVRPFGRGPRARLRLLSESDRKHRHPEDGGHRQDLPSPPSGRVRPPVCPATVRELRQADRGSPPDPGIRRQPTRNPAGLLDHPCTPQPGSNDPSTHPTVTGRDPGRHDRSRPLYPEFSSVLKAACCRESRALYPDATLRARPSLQDRASLSEENTLTDWTTMQSQCNLLRIRRIPKTRRR